VFGVKFACFFPPRIYKIARDFKIFPRNCQIDSLQAIHLDQLHRLLTFNALPFQNRKAKPTAGDNNEFDSEKNLWVGERRTANSMHESDKTEANPQHEGKFPGNSSENNRTRHQLWLIVLLI
jgi:hypothetical protein